MPLFTREYDGLGSTQDYVREVLALAARTPFTTHLEIETYTWDVLPPGLKIDLLESIAREYEWVLADAATHEHIALSRRPTTRSSDIRSTKQCTRRSSSTSSA